jgi:hypothetical protein
MQAGSGSDGGVCLHATPERGRARAENENDSQSGSAEAPLRLERELKELVAPTPWQLNGKIKWE